MVQKTNTIDTAPPIQVLQAESGGTLTVPGQSWLLEADFAPQGPDLLLTGPDGTQVLIRDFFNLETPPDLMTDAGGVISADLATKLAGPVVSGQLAMTGSNPFMELAQASESIGRVEATDGLVEAIRIDGSKVTLTKGDDIYQGDTLVTAKGAAAGITFVDDTTFSLGEEGRMVLDEMVYDPGTQEGAFNANLVQGVFSFVSGKIAKTSPDAMTVTTPVVTIGIRGTKVAGRAAQEGAENTISLLPETDAQGNQSVGELAITNQGGTVTLSSVGATVQMTSAFSPPPPPVVFSQEQIQQNFGASLTTLATTAASKATSDAAENAENAEQAEADAEAAAAEADAADEEAAQAEAEAEAAVAEAEAARAEAEASGDEEAIAEAEAAEAEAEAALAEAEAKAAEAEIATQEADAAAEEAETAAEEAQAAQEEADHAAQEMQAQTEAFAAFGGGQNDADAADDEGDEPEDAPLGADEGAGPADEGGEADRAADDAEDGPEDAGNEDEIGDGGDLFGGTDLFGGGDLFGGSDLFGGAGLFGDGDIFGTDAFLDGGPGQEATGEAFLDGLFGENLFGYDFGLDEEESEDLLIDLLVDSGSFTEAEILAVVDGGLEDGRENLLSIGGTGDSIAAKLNIGYYDMSLGQGNSTQASSITTAGHTAVNMSTLSASDLAGVDVLIVQNPSNSSYGAEFLLALDDISSAVSNGLVMYVNDRYVSGASTILGGLSSPTMTKTGGSDITVLDTSTVLAEGPGGHLNDTSLDGGSSSYHGYVDENSLPTSSTALLSTADSIQIVDFAYAHGTGGVVYSSIPLDYYLGTSSTSTVITNMSTVYAPNAVQFAASLILDGYSTLTGTSAAETIAGTANGETIMGGAGNDTIFGLYGNDILKGEAGNDTLIGGSGSDTLTGGEGNDTFTYTTITANKIGWMDKITDFVAGGSGDKIDTNILGTMSVIANQSTGDTLANLDLASLNTFANSTDGTLATALGGGSTNTQAMQLTTTDSQVVWAIDVDGSGVFDNSDTIINVTGVTGDINASDFV